MAVSSWSTTASSNTDLFPENLQANSYNNNLRQMQADLANWQQGNDARYVAPAGTVSAPSLTFTGETDCGFYKIGAANVGFSINGTKLLDLGAASVVITGAAAISAGLAVTQSTTNGNCIVATANGTGYGVRGVAGAGAAGAGVRGEGGTTGHGGSFTNTSATLGACVGVNSGTGPGTYGFSVGYGVQGVSSGSYGVHGVSSATHGVFGQSGNAGAAGVIGITAGSASIYGLLGVGTTGVQGVSTSGVGGDFSSTGNYGLTSRGGSGHGGVLGYTNDFTKYGILGFQNAYSFYGIGAIYNSGAAGIGVVPDGSSMLHAQGNGFGVRGESSTSYGVKGGTAAQNVGGVIGYASDGSCYGILGFQSSIGPTNYSFLGSHQASFAGTTYASDERLKRNIRDADGRAILAKLKALRVRLYNWRENTHCHAVYGDADQIGLIAQEVRQVFPDWVSETPVPQFPDAPGEAPRTRTLDEQMGSHLSLNNASLIPGLLAAVAVLADENVALTARIEALEAR